MFLVDLKEKRVVKDAELKQKLAAAHDYGAWLSEQQITWDHIGVSQEVGIYESEGKRKVENNRHNQHILTLYVEMFYSNRRHSASQRSPHTYVWVLPRTRAHAPHAHDRRGRRRSWKYGQRCCIGMHVSTTTGYLRIFQATFCSGISIYLTFSLFYLFITLFIFYYLFFNNFL